VDEYTLRRPGAQNSGEREVRFLHEDRPDPSFAFLSGELWRALVEPRRARFRKSVDASVDIVNVCDDVSERRAGQGDLAMSVTAGEIIISSTSYTRAPRRLDLFAS